MFEEEIDFVEIEFTEREGCLIIFVPENFALQDEKNGKRVQEEGYVKVKIGDSETGKKKYKMYGEKKYKMYQISSIPFKDTLLKHLAELAKLQDSVGTEEDSVGTEEWKVKVNKWKVKVNNAKSLNGQNSFTMEVYTERNEHTERNELT